MSHSWFEEQLGPWWDGELAGPESQRMETHLADCAACRSRVEEMRVLSTALRGLERHSMPADLKQRLPADPPVARRGPWLLASVAAAAGIVAIVMVMRPMVMRPGVETDRPASGQFAQTPAELQEPTEPPRVVAEMRPPEKKTAPEDRVEPTRPAVPPSPARPSPSSLRRQRPPQQGVTRDERTAQGSEESGDARIAGVMKDEPALAAEGDMGTQGDIRGKDDVVPPSGIQQHPAAAPATSPTIVMYETELVLTDSETPRLSPLVPAIGSAGGAPAAVPTSGATAGTGSARATRTAEKTESSFGFAKQQVESTRMTFLLKLDPDGKVVSAEPVGARLAPVARVKLVQGLLVASTLPPRTTGDPTLVVVEVTVPANP